MKHSKSALFNTVNFLFAVPQVIAENAFQMSYFDSNTANFVNLLNASTSHYPLSYALFECRKEHLLLKLCASE